MPLPLPHIYDKLLNHYGPQSWWPADSSFEVMVGAVLVQSTAWRNVERAIANLKSAGTLSPAAIRDMSLHTLEELIRPSGFYRVKAKRLRALCEYLGDRCADSIELLARRPTHDLRRELLAVYGVGEETADDILLYALGRPVFVIDAFTRRVFHRLGWCSPTRPTRSFRPCSKTACPQASRSTTSTTPSSSDTATQPARSAPTAPTAPYSPTAPESASDPNSIN